MKTRYGSAHAENGIKRVKRLLCAESITTDVSADCYLFLLESIEKTSVGTACAKYGRTTGNIEAYTVEFLCFTENCLCNKSLRIFTLKSENILAVNLDAEFLTMIFNVRVKFFNYIDCFALFCKIKNLLFGKRIYTTEF